jgi:hypothetical protein
MTKGTPRSGKIAPAAQGQETYRSPRIGVAPKGPAPEASESANPILALESAQYIAQMSAELAAMARSANLDLLAYFLDMARVEATSSVRKLEDRPE